MLTAPAPPAADDDLPAASAERLAGRGGIVLICEHASRRIPARYGDLGLTEEAARSHAAWDPGALDVARQLSEMLDAPLVKSNVSRLVVDCNRAPDAPDAMRARSEVYDIPGNRTLGVADKDERLASVYLPFHRLLAEVIDSRPHPPSLVSIHSFTPVYNGAHRPWQVGILSDHDRRLADHMLAGLGRQPGLSVGDNQPYAPTDGVYWTLDRHGTRRGLATAMVEIRNDELTSSGACRAWADTLALAIRGWRA